MCMNTLEYNEPQLILKALSLSSLIIVSGRYFVELFKCLRSEKKNSAKVTKLASRTVFFFRYTGVRVLVFGL